MNMWIVVLLNVVMIGLWLVLIYTWWWGITHYIALFRPVKVEGPSVNDSFTEG